jgi:predicted  nucleic acid-binding Zn-ribbon protein
MTPGFDEEQMKRLIKLQELQNEMRAIEVFLSRTDHRIEALDADLTAMEQSLALEEDDINALNQQCRSYESEIKINTSKIEKSQTKLRAVKTNKEYQSSLKEIDDLNLLNSKLEDKTLECLERIDQLESFLNKRRSDHETMAAETEFEKTQIRKEVEKAVQKLSELKSDSSKISQALDPALLGLFNQIKDKQPDRIGIAPVINAVCQGCNLNIPPQVYNELYRWNSLKRCPNCERIIYLGNNIQRSE